MQKTVFLTGSSSGIGKATVKCFHDHGWNVVATMRTPSREASFGELKNTLVLPLDVTEESSIHLALKNAISHFGKIDVLVNNAGYGLMGTFESTSASQVKRQFDTNFFGCLNVIRATLPHFREQRSGTIVNITSVGGRMSMPLFSLYHASKFAVEGFSESLRFELKPLGIRVKVVEPGPVLTDFSGRSLDLTSTDNWKDYESYQSKVVEKVRAASQQGETAEYTARDIYRAATDRKWRLRYPSGKLSKALLYTRPFVPDEVFRFSMEKNFSAN